jgi:hypothetical protein
MPHAVYPKIGSVNAPGGMRRNLSRTGRTKGEERGSHALETSKMRERTLDLIENKRPALGSEPKTNPHRSPIKVSSKPKIRRRTASLDSLPAQDDSKNPPRTPALSGRMPSLYGEAMTALARRK